MSDANKAAAHQLYERFSEGDLSVIDEVISDDFVEHEVMPGLEPNKDGSDRCSGCSVRHFATQPSKSMT